DGEPDAGKRTMETWLAVHETRQEELRRFTGPWPVVAASWPAGVEMRPSSNERARKGCGAERSSAAAGTCRTGRAPLFHRAPPSEAPAGPRTPARRQAA